MKFSNAAAARTAANGDTPAPAGTHLMKVIKAEKIEALNKFILVLAKVQEPEAGSSVAIWTDLANDEQVGKLIKTIEVLGVPYDDETGFIESDVIGAYGEVDVTKKADKKDPTKIYTNARNVRTVPPEVMAAILAEA